MNPVHNTHNLIKTYYGCFNNKNYNNMAELLCENVIHEINQGHVEIGKTKFYDFLVKMASYYQEAIDNLTILVSEDGLKATAEFVVLGNYVNTAPGLPEASNQTYLLNVGCFFEIKNNKISRVSNYYNVTEWLNQINPIKNNVTIKPLFGEQIHKHLEEFAHLRINIFKNYPYLYNGNINYEKDYLNAYLQSQNSVLIGAFYNNELVGGATAILMQDSYPEVKQPFLAQNYNINNIVYFGESVLLDRFQNSGIGHKFFIHRELFALSYKNVNYTTFCHVVRDSNSLNITNTIDNKLYALWNSHRYFKDKNLTSFFSWQDIGEKNETQKTMQFMLKKWERF